MATRPAKIEMYWTLEGGNFVVNWRLKGGNGEVMCQSTQGYRDKIDCTRQPAFFYSGDPMTLADLIKRAEWLVANRPPTEAVDLLRSWTPSAASALKDMGQALKETLELIAAVNALSDGISERLETKPSPQKYGVPFGLVNDLNAAAKKVEASKPAQAEARHIATGADMEWQAKIFHAEMDKLGVPRDDGEDFYSLIGRANLALEAAGRGQQAEPVAVLRFQRDTPGHENDMPAVVSCNWLPDGDYRVYLATPAERAPAPTVAEQALAEVAECFDAAMIEGLLEVLAETADARLKDLVERRLMFAHAIAAQAAPTAQEASKPMTLADAAKSFPNGPFGQPHIEASKPAQAEAASEPMRAHIEQFATRAGWKMEEGEGAFEFVQRKCYQQGWIDHGTKSRDREDDTSASQDQGPDTGRVSGESGPAAEQHNEHRTGQSGADREHDQRDCRGAGLHGASNLPPQVAQKPDFIYNGERGRDAEDLLDGYNHGTAFYASPVLLRIDRAIEPLTSGEIRALMAKHGIAFANINTVEALVRDVELEHGRGVANPKARAAHSPASGVVEREALALDIKSAIAELASGAVYPDLLEAIDKLAALATQPLEQKPVGYMNAGHVHELQQKRTPYGYVYPEETTGAHVAVYIGAHPEQVAQDLTDEEINAIWSEEDQPLRKSKLSAFGMQRIRAIIHAARASGQKGNTP